MPKPNFWAVARRPKWIGGLALAMLVAITFSLLMQWQLSRTFNTVGVSVEQSQPVPIDQLLTPNQVIQSAVFDRRVSFQARLDPSNAHVVSDRFQLTETGESVRGYWLISNSEVNGASLTLALGFTRDLAIAQAALAKLKPMEFEAVGFVEPTEAVKEATPEALGSVALSQLINLYSAEPIDAFPAYVILESGLDTRLEPITIGIRQQQVEINWLTAFYAIEWAFFALAAFYLWWRLVMDQVQREREAE